MSHLLKNATVIVPFPPEVERVDLRVKNGLIVERGEDLQGGPGDEVSDLRGKILMPGLVCAHTHLYSSLSRGMPGPAEPPANFLEILQKIWWKLDRALDEESVYMSALVGAVEALQSGVTTIVDHHASPRYIRGSLDTIQRALAEVGLRGVLAYEVSDRGGGRERDAGLEENERFLRKTSHHANFRGLVGAHAAFTLSDDSLRLLGELAAKHRTGVHIHAAEDLSDIVDARENYRCGLIERLERHAILLKRSVLVHGVHLSEEECARVRAAGSWIVHNPRSNMNNGVGTAPVHLFGERTALGTDGFPADMLQEAAAGYFSRRQSGLLPDVSMPRILQAGQEMISEIFGKKFGTLQKGSPADLVVMDYIPPTPLVSTTLESHLLFGMRSSMVESVMVDGRWVLKNREVTGSLDLRTAWKDAARSAKRLWTRMQHGA